MFCAKCGNQIGEGVKFCTQCGASVETASQTTAGDFVRGISGSNLPDVSDVHIKYAIIAAGAIHSLDILKGFFLFMNTMQMMLLIFLALYSGLLYALYEGYEALTGNRYAESMKYCGVCGGAFVLIGLWYLSHAPMWGFLRLLTGGALLYGAMQLSKRNA